MPEVVHIRSRSSPPPFLGVMSPEHALRGIALTRENLLAARSFLLEDRSRSADIRSVYAAEVRRGRRRAV
jgi:hypothetical protein